MLADSQHAFTSRLVSATQDSSAVYAVYEHEQFGLLIGAYLVAHNPGGGLSLRYQRLLPENVDQFASSLDETDLRLVEILGQITPHQIQKRFADKGMTPAKFTKKFGAPPYKEVLFGYIRQQLGEAIPLLFDKPFFLSAADGYPADKRLTVHREPATIRFFFDRSVEGTDYRVEVKLGNRYLKLHEQDGLMLLDEPAWIQSGDSVFTFEGDVDGKKLKPFLQKPVIRIVPKFEQEYYEKFLTRLLEQHEVQLSGFELEDVSASAVFKVVLTRDASKQYQIAFKVEYAGTAFRPTIGPEAQVRVLQNGSVRFQKIVRNMVLEAEKLSVFRAALGGAGLFDVPIDEESAYRWLEDHAAALEAAGISIAQDFPGPKLHIGGHILRYAVTANGALVHAVPLLEAGGHTVPMDRFFDTLKQTERPPLTTLNGTLVYLRDEELLTLRHLLEVGHIESGRLRLSPAQAAVIPGQHSSASEQSNNGMVPETKLPKGMQATLRPYQKAGYDWLVFLKEHNLGGILADDMGLGKTLQALALLQHEKEKGATLPSLVVVPNSLIFNWVEEAKRFCPSLRIHIYGGTKRNRSEQSLFNYDVLLTTYGMVRQDIAKLGKSQFHYIILDESQYIKNRDAKTTQAVLKLQAQYRVSLTGTPIENSTLELWTQFQFLNPGQLGGRKFFEEHYAIPIEKQADEQRAHRLKGLVRPFILRRTKQQVAPELPELVEQIRYCELSPLQEKMYDEQQELLQASLFSEALSSDAGFEKAKFQILSSLQRLRQIAIHPGLIEPGLEDTGGKYEAVWDHLDEILADGSKVLIFSQFVKLLDILRKDLKTKGITYAYLDGQTKDRQKEVEKFQTQDDIQVFLISLKAGGVGLNLTAAEYVLVLDPWWNPAVERQAIARAHRIGQAKTVFAYKFISQGTIEDAILEMQARKSKVADDIIQSDEQFFKSLTRQELISLLNRPRQPRIAEPE